MCRKAHKKAIKVRKKTVVSSIQKDKKQLKTYRGYKEAAQALRGLGMRATGINKIGMSHGRLPHLLP